MSKKTIDYYNTNANEYFKDTVGVEFSKNQDRFLKYIEQGSLILDFGCGSGRDTKYFTDKGYVVHAIDGSIEMCKIATEYSGIQVKQLYFQDFNEINKYDGVWACSSILHLDYSELQKVLINVGKSLKEEGILYTSFKYSDFEGTRNGRYFIDMKEERLNELLSQVKLFNIEELWITTDVRPERDDEKWLNLILRKKN